MFSYSHGLTVTLQQSATFYLLDMSAARHANVLFVKQKEDGDNDLAAFCKREGIPHILFEDFGKALNAVKSVVEGEKSVQEILTIGRAQ